MSRLEKQSEKSRNNAYCIIFIGIIQIATLNIIGFI